MHTLSRLSALLFLLPLVLAEVPVPTDTECSVSKSTVFDDYFTIYFSQPKVAGQSEQCQRFRLPGKPNEPLTGYSQCVNIESNSVASNATIIALPLPVSNQCWKCHMFSRTRCIGPNISFYRNMYGTEPDVVQKPFKSFMCWKVACSDMDGGIAHGHTVGHADGKTDGKTDGKAASIKVRQTSSTTNTESDATASGQQPTWTPGRE